MNSTMKRGATGALALVLTVTLAACGGDEPVEAVAEATESPTPEAPSLSPAEQGMVDAVESCDAESIAIHDAAVEGELGPDTDALVCVADAVGVADEMLDTVNEIEEHLDATVFNPTDGRSQLDYLGYTVTSTSHYDEDAEEIILTTAIEVS